MWRLDKPSNIDIAIIIIVKQKTIIKNILIFQYPMQFGGPLRNISNLCSALLYAGKWWFNLHH